MTAVAILVALAGFVIGFAGYVWLRARAEVQRPYVWTETPIFFDLLDEYRRDGKWLPGGGPR